MVDENEDQASKEKDAVMTFLQNQQIPHVGMSTATELGDFSTDTGLGDWFKRPVRVTTFTWLESEIQGTNRTFAIWNDWATNTYVLNKLNNYSFMRGNLQIKVQVSASPFYYGMLQMSYRPLTTFKSSTIITDAATRWLIPTSQRPKVNINPQHGDTYSMTLPFIYPTNMVNLQSASALQDLGFLAFDVYSALQSANGVTGTGITVTIYAWMEDIVLSGASAGYAAQGDEYGEGPVSKPASWLASLAGTLESIPIIGRFATATRIGASAVSTIAGMFGFTNVPVITQTEPMRPDAFPKMASSEIGYPVEKLTLDPKNELTIDPMVVGMPSGEDEMVIRSICARESYLCTSQWDSSEAVDTIKFSSVVSPMLVDIDATTANELLYAVPMAWVGAMFKYWRGDIIFTFRVISSKYHKGKLRISYDPSGLNSGTYNIITNANTSNIVQTTIMDIGETNEVEFIVPYQQRQQFMITKNINYKGWSTSSSPTFTRDDQRDNGMLTVRVQNILTGPTSSSVVDILVYVKAGPNMEFASPNEIDTTHNFSYYQAQSDEYVQKTISDKVVMGDKYNNEDHQYLVHFGENVVSLRQLLRRYSKVQSDYFPTTAVADTFRQGIKNSLRLPLTPGYVSTGYTTANKIVGVGTYGYNFVEFTHLAWTANAFLCFRGSTNWSFDVASNTPIKHLRCSRISNTQATASIGATSIVVSTNSQLARAALNYSGASGSAITNQLTQSGVNVTFPMYTNSKFLSTDPLNSNVGSLNDGSYYDTLSLVVDYPFPATLVTDGIIVNSYCGVGTDFGLYFFLNVPTIVVYSPVPTAV